MKKSKSLPEFVESISTYEELATYARAFAEGHFNLLLLGGPGVGKSQHLRAAVGGRGYLIEGNATPFGIYLAAYEHRDEPIILDDVDGLYRNPSGVRLLKALCQTDLVKTVSWNSDSQALERRGVPCNFDTTSKVAIIANGWKSLTCDVSALEDRTQVIHFAPSAFEVHKYAASWFWNQSIFDFTAANLHLIARPSLRIYVRAAERMAAGMNWTDSILSCCLRGTALEVARLRNDSKYSSEEARVKEFVRLGHGSRATYFNHAKRISPTTEPPRLKLDKTNSSATANQPALLELLRLRQESLGNG